MKSSLIYFGFVAAYVAVSFVPPQPVTVDASMPSFEIPSLTLPSLDHVTNSVSSFGDLLGNAQKINIEKTAKQLAASGVETGIDIAEEEAMRRLDVAPPAREIAYEEDDPDFRAVFQTINRAMSEGKIRDCYALPPIVLKERVVAEEMFSSPSSGDWISFCLAVVTKESGRCASIGDRISPPLKLLCDSETPSSAIHTSVFSF